MKILVKCIFLLFVFSCNNLNNYTSNNILCKVIGVKDGDTIEVYFDGKSETIRLLDIDCPEKKQAFGTKAKQFTSDLCFGKEVKIVSNRKRDRYKRLLGTVYIDDLNLNEELLKAGLAWHFKKYSNKSHYAKLENTARANKSGLWNDNNPIAPWEFRKK